MRDKEAADLIEFLKECRPDMHEPDEQNVRHVRLLGDHLDNACGNSITLKAIIENYQEYILIIRKDGKYSDGSGYDELFINLANLIAFARIGAEQILKEKK